MRWPWDLKEEEKKALDENKQEINKVKTRLDKVESIDIIAEELAIMQRNGDQYGN